MTGVVYLNPYYRADHRDRIAAALSALQLADENLDYAASTTQASHLVPQMADRLIAAQDDMRAALRASHRTVEDYAKWYFETYAIEGATGATPDFASMKTCDDVEKAWSDLSIDIQTKEMMARARLPQSSSSLFTRNITTERRVLDTANFKISAIVITEKSDGLTRICIRQEPGDIKPSVISLIDELATDIYLTEQRQYAPSPEPDRLFARSLKSLLSAFNKSVKDHPEEFEFYIHVPPEHGGREQFIRMDMDWENGHYQHPRPTYFHDIPVFVQNACVRAENTAFHAQSAPNPG